MEKDTKKNETEVANSQFLSIFENSINAILFGIPDGTLLDANPAAVEMFGYSIEELRGLGRNVIFDTTDPKMIAALKTRLETGKAKGEIIGIHKNGERFPCEFSSAIFKTETGEFRTSTVLNDISERKKAEKKLEQTLNLLNRTSALAKIGGWEIDFTNKEYYLSYEIYKILEVDDNFTPTIDRVTTFFVPESKKIIKKAIRDGIKKGISWDLELQMITAKEKVINVRAQGYVIAENNKTIKLLGTIQDITERKNTVERLIESEQLFKTIFDAEPECVKLIDPKGDLIEINKAGIKIHEADSIEQMKSLPIIKFIIPEHRNAFNELHNSTMNGQQGILEFEIKGLKGTRRWLESHSAPIFDSSGNVAMMLSVTRDITERKISEKTLLESQQRFKTIFEAVPESVQLINTDGEVIEMNNAGLLMLDADSVAHVNSFGINSFVLPKYKIAFKKLYDNAMMGIKGMLEFEIKSIKGTKKWFETRTVPMVNSENKIETTLAVTRDITQNKKEEHFLKLLESVITNTNDSVMITEAEPFDEPGPKIVYVNEAFTKMTGYTFDEVVGKSPRILQGPKSDKEELKRLSEAIRKWKPCEVSVINYRKNGEEFWINFSIKPVADETGWFTHWIAVERDVTQQKNNDLEREQIMAELSQNNNDLKQFSYVTSHNLRAPIANLLGLTSLLDQYEISDKSLLQILDGIRKSALIFDDTVKDLTKVLIIKDQTNIIKEEVSFLNVINNILRQLSIAINDHDVKVNYNFDDASSVNFTTAYLESILLNLFTNAIKYKSSKRKLKINIITFDAGDFIILKFEDNGIGIDTEKYKDKLFKLYQRFHENSDGKGLGLYLTKSQIEALGGTIEIESEVGKGTVFILKFRK